MKPPRKRMRVGAGVVFIVSGPVEVFLPLYVGRRISS